MDAIEFVKKLVKNGNKVGIFSCEDPYNKPFHRDILKTSDFLHLVPQTAGRVIPSSLDLGLQAKGINAWGVFGHYGIINGHEVCAAIKALNNGHSDYGPHLSEYIQSLSKEFNYNSEISLKENIKLWVNYEYEKLLRLAPEKQSILKGAVQGDIIIFGGLVENSHYGKRYKANILFSNSE